MAKNHLIRGAARAWFRKNFQALSEIGVTASGPRVNLSIRAKDEPKETRIGRYIDDKSPFYEMDRVTLRNYYHAYKQSYEERYWLLYADTLAFRMQNLHPVLPNSIDCSEFELTLDAVRFQIPFQMREYADEAVDFFKKIGKLNFDPKKNEYENNDSLRVSKLTPDGKMTCQHATYFDQIATNLTLDWASDMLPNNAHTIRSGLERPIDGALPSFSESILANTLGTAVVFYTKDLRKALIRTRSDDMASIAQQRPHCTVSGVLEVEPGISPGKFGINFFDYGTNLEIKMETGLDKDQYLLFPIAVSRELPRGGKPQLFYVAVLLIEEDEFEIFCASAEEKSEYIENAKGSFFSGDSIDPKRMVDAFTYEGFAAFVFAQNFVDANEDELLELVSRN